MSPYRALAVLVLSLHVFFILWVIFGAFFTRGRPRLARVHILSVVWGLLVEIFPWTCPLTFAERWLEARGGIGSYQGSFLLHYLDSTIYPNIPPWVLTASAVVVFLTNVAIYAVRSLRRRRSEWLAR